jgi:phage FluMu protein Com
MTAAARLPGSLEDHCPACGASLAIAPGSRRKKVQCPKCREIVTLPVAPTPATAEICPAPTTPGAVDELAALRARVEILEGQLAWLMDHRPAAEAALLRPGQSLRWLRGTADWAEQSEILRHNLRAMRTAALRITTTADDPALRRRAEQLREIFLDAAWLVPAVEARALAGNLRGLSLRGAACPPHRGLTACSMALTAAGFHVCCCQDATLAEDDIVLVVAP